MPFYLDKGGIHAFAQIFPIRREQAHAPGRSGVVRPARGGHDHAACQRRIRHDRMDYSNIPEEARSEVRETID